MMEGILEYLYNPLVLSILVNMAVFLIVTLSLNLETGFAGIPQFGRVLAVIAGAIGAGAIAGRMMAAMMGLPAGIEYVGDQNFVIVGELNKALESNPLLSIGALILSLAVAAVMGGIMGYLASYPAIRLKEAYLGITLLAFGDALQIVGMYYDPLAGGTAGIVVPDVFRFVGTGEIRFLSSTLIILGIAILVYLYVQSLARSPFGRALKAMRDNELAAKVYGKDIVNLRAKTLIIGGALAGMGGALWTLYTGSFKALTYNRLTWTFWPWAFMMLGGTGNNLGIVLGTLVFSTVRSLIYAYKTELTAFIPINPNWLEYLLIGVIIIAIALFRPQGILPEKPELPLSRKKIESIRASLAKGD
ncbi:MAG: branched-chain amino acid ABC transporter permease [Candidatus Korarchaeota archaeon]|nr:branched-chain amino acid ABC transporter permease [Candidatus Korarchaeota archaeon]